MMDTEKTQLPSYRNFSLPIAGFVAGVLLWVMDAYIDVYILKEEQTLMENIFTPEATEAWMRTLVVIVLTSMGFYARGSILRLDELTQRLVHYQANLELLVKERTVELEEKKARLEVLASTDPLTGLYNRRVFLEFLDKEAHRSKRYQHTLCIMMLDIDHFKSINDTYGHDVGDKVLIEFAELVNDGIRKSDVLARWGGEEFILLVPETSLDNGMKLADKLLSIIHNYRFDAVGKVTVSIGVASSETETDIKSLLKAADEALYTAKQAGRDCVKAA